MENFKNSPSFEQWLDKYFEEPKMKKMYKTKLDGKEYSEDELKRRHKRAYKQLKCQCTNTEKYYDPVGDVERCQKCEKAL